MQCSSKPGENVLISTHAPAGGATCRACVIIFVPVAFLLTPLREGRHALSSLFSASIRSFLLTPLREGRPSKVQSALLGSVHFYSRPCGRGDDVRFRKC